MASEYNVTYYYEVTIVDSRVENDDAAAELFSVRATDDEAAKLKATLRGRVAEGDLPHLDFVVRRIGAIKAYDAAAAAALDDEDEDE